MMPSYECVGGPWDGLTVSLPQDNELRVCFGPPPSGEDDQTIEQRVGIYRLFRPKKKHLTYLKWMGEL